jgi:hypothetical protein
MQQGYDIDRKEQDIECLQHAGHHAGLARRAGGGMRPRQCGGRAEQDCRAERYHRQSFHPAK